MDNGIHPSEATGFEWEEDNVMKNWDKHGITNWECEEAFYNRPLVIKEEKEHSKSEKRYYALGHTDGGKLLFIAFTMRGTSIRPISFREMTKKERRIYEQYQKK